MTRRPTARDRFQRQLRSELEKATRAAARSLGGVTPPSERDVAIYVLGWLYGAAGVSDDEAAAWRQTPRGDDGDTER